MGRYPMPSEIDASSSFMRIPEYANQVTLGNFFSLVLLAIFVIIAGVSFWAKKDLISSLAMSSFVTWILATILWVANLVSAWAFGITLGLMITFYVALWIERND